MSANGDMACDILLGDSSPLYLRLYDQGLIINCQLSAAPLRWRRALRISMPAATGARAVAERSYREAEPQGGGT